MDSPRKQRIPSSPPPMAGQKRSAASLLPPFEPLSSPPAIDLPRPTKRRALSPARLAASAMAGGGTATMATSAMGGMMAPAITTTASAATTATASARAKYPTPFPTSATGIGSSPPQRRGPFRFTSARPSLGQSNGNAGPEQRAPLSAVPYLELPESGETILMGRSSNSSNYQLSANRLTSRVHVKARYIPPPAPLDPPRVEIVCMGWNGLKLHSQGRTWELCRGDSFTSETEGTDLLIDVNDARVLVQWPPRGTDKAAALSDDSPWEDSPCQPTSAQRSSRFFDQSSPLRRGLGGGSVAYPPSPTPANVAISSQRLQDLLPAADTVEIYEDGSDAEGDDEGMAGGSGYGQQAASPRHTNGNGTAIDLGASMVTLKDPFAPEYLESEDKDPNEENDPVVHAFGPFGANLNSRMASITATSPRLMDRRRLESVTRDIGPPAQEEEGDGGVKDDGAEDDGVEEFGVKNAGDEDAGGDDQQGRAAAPRSPRSSHSDSLSPPPMVHSFDTAAIANHAINQLAFSRLASTPLSTILASLPAEHKHDGALTKDTLRPIIEDIECVGTIERQGKDAAGKPLESEYYYLPEKDGDDDRRLAVTDGLGRPSLRNCRKQHKQYFWKKPRMP